MTEAELTGLVEGAIEAAVAVERERCARIADNHARGDDEGYAEAACVIADEIRAQPVRS